jgi:hypothetical protein
LTIDRTPRSMMIARSQEPRQSFSKEYKKTGRNNHGIDERCSAH